MPATINSTPLLDALDDQIQALEVANDLDGLTELHRQLEMRLGDLSEGMATVDDRRAGRDRPLL